MTDMLIDGPIEAWGYIPMFVEPSDPTPMHKQIAAAYIGGWHPFDGFEVVEGSNEEDYVLQYPEDPPLKETARITRIMGDRVETIVLFPYSWVLWTPDGGKNYEISRCD